MMKKLICGMLVLLTVAVSCKKEDIEVYQGKPRIEFVYTNAETVFGDRDYLGNISERIVALEVRCLGANVEQPLKYFLKTEEENGDVVIQPGYEFVAEEGVGSAQIAVRRPKSVGSSWETEIVFDMENSANGFEAGRMENQKCKLVVSYVLQPSKWNLDLWGIYSNNKYIFMMDQLQQVYDDMLHTKETRNQIRKAYEEYRKSNPPLMDDENPKNEISFPQD